MLNRFLLFILLHLMLDLNIRILARHSMETYCFPKHSKRGNENAIHFFTMAVIIMKEDVLCESQSF